MRGTWARTWWCCRWTCTPCPACATIRPDRCYICKTAVFTALWDYARAHGFDTLADGSNADDVGDYRPGMRALKELGVSQPASRSSA